MSNLDRWGSFNSFLRVEGTPETISPGQSLRVCFQPPGHAKPTMMTPQVNRLLQPRDVFCQLSRAWHVYGGNPVSQHAHQQQTAKPEADHVLPLLVFDNCRVFHQQAALSAPCWPLGRTSPQVVKYNPGTELRWRGKLWGTNLFFVGEHYFTLKPLGPNKTLLLHGEARRGGVNPHLAALATAVLVTTVIPVAIELLVSCRALYWPKI
jgi:hypothetical protein